MPIRLFNNTSARCTWATHPEEIEYHDEEWGVPCLDDNRHFEFLILESAQAGLSWLTILKKRAGYKECFADFDPVAVAEFTLDDISRLMLDERIVRNHKKIESAIGNARVFLNIQAQYGSFCKYIWDFTNGRVLDGKRKNIKDIPPVSTEAEKLSADLKSRGCRFLGPTTLYAHMQSTGLVNDHLTTCFRYPVVKAMAKELGLN